MSDNIRRNGDDSSMQSIKKAQIKLIERKIVDDKTVISSVQYGKITVHIKSVFNGKKYIDDVIFNIAKEKINKEKHD
jgi:hypothetical protein